MPVVTAFTDQEATKTKAEIIGVLTLLVVCQDTEASEVAFSSPPEITRVDKGARIEFVASTATDCEIAILDGTGEVVRHLAAGALDKRAPPPLKTKSRSVWSGKARRDSRPP